MEKNKKCLNRNKYIKLYFNILKNYFGYKNNYIFFKKKIDDIPDIFLEKIDLKFLFNKIGLNTSNLTKEDINNFYEIVNFIKNNYQKLVKENIKGIFFLYYPEKILITKYLEATKPLLIFKNLYFFKDFYHLVYTDEKNLSEIKKKLKEIKKSININFIYLEII